MLYNNSQPAGYAAEPLETVNYAGCHDGEVLFDQLIMKAADDVRCHLPLHGSAKALNMHAVAASLLLYAPRSAARGTGVVGLTCCMHSFFAYQGPLNIRP